MPVIARILIRTVCHFLLFHRNEILFLWVCFMFCNHVKLTKIKVTYIYPRSLQHENIDLETIKFISVLVIARMLVSTVKDAIFFFSIEILFLFYVLKSCKVNEYQSHVYLSSFTTTRKHRSRKNQDIFIDWEGECEIITKHRSF